MRQHLNNAIPGILLVAMALAAYFGGPPHIVLKLVAIFTLLWFVPLVTTKLLRGHAVTADVFAVNAAAGCALAWSMGWLS